MVMKTFSNIKRKVGIKVMKQLRTQSLQEKYSHAFCLSSNTQDPFRWSIICLSIFFMCFRNSCMFLIADCH